MLPFAHHGTALLSVTNSPLEVEQVIVESPTRVKVLGQLTVMTVSVGIGKVVVVVRGDGSEDSRQSRKYFIVSYMHQIPSSD